jgi:hypothetical protein
MAASVGSWAWVRGVAERLVAGLLETGRSRARSCSSGSLTVANTSQGTARTSLSHWDVDSRVDVLTVQRTPVPRKRQHLNRSRQRYSLGCSGGISGGSTELRAGEGLLWITARWHTRDS